MSLTDKMNLDKTDPWLAWCSPVHNAATQPWLLDYPEQCKWFKRDSAEFLEYMKESFALKHLIVATDEITSKSRDIVPEVPDVKHHPVPSLNFNFYTGERSTYSYDPIMIFLDDLLDDSTHSPNLFRNLLMFAIAWPHPQAVEQLKKLAPIVIQLLMAAHRFLLKKIALAKTMGLKRAAKKLEDADKNFCMIDLTDNIDKDAEQLFLVKKITPDAFRAAMRRAFKLDREATDEINGVGNATLTPKPQQVSTGYTEADRKRDEETHAFVSNLKPKQVERQNAARLINEIYHSDELAAYATSKGKKRTSRQFAILYIRHNIPKKSKFYARAEAVRNSVLMLAKSSSTEDIEAVWNSILTTAKNIDPKKGKQKHTEDYYENQYENRYGEDSRIPGIVPNIGDASSDR